MKLRHSDLSIPSEGVWLDGALSHSPDVRGLAIILMANAHTPSKGRESSIARWLQQSGYATLIVSLVTHQEDARDPDARYNVPQMARRLLGVADWVGHQPALAPLSMGLVAASTTSGAAIRAAWKAPGRFDAIVCHAGRPDLAGATPLRSLSTPIRVIVGSNDTGAAIVAQAFELIGAERDWQVITGASEVFDQPHTLERFASLAADWFALKLAPPRPEPAAEQATTDTPLTPSE